MSPDIKPEHDQAAVAANVPANVPLIAYYEAIERASADMLEAARTGNWDQVVKIEGACVLLISQLKFASRESTLSAQESRIKQRIMQRILLNDAQIRDLAEPWLVDLNHVLQGRRVTLH